MIDFPLKLINSVSIMMDSVLKMMDYAFKMMNLYQ